ncbi:hypothetical protein BKA63DRAFT_490673 [Paraphoma chrysanthemicola]|nr:hypothetical protein BKA63DRAFT_490673 [Paraphoma chrysanthemicola]
MTSRPTYSNPGGKKDTKDTNDRTIKMESLLSIEDCIGPGKTAFCLWDDKFKNDYLDKKIKYEKHVYDQGENIGSCAANAVAAAYRYALQRQGLPDFLPSRLFLYWVARMSDDENWVNLEPTESTPNPVSPQSLVPPQWGVEDDGWGIFYEGFAKSPPRLVNLLRKDAGSEPRDVIQCMARLGAPAETSRLYGWAPGTFPYPFGDLGDPSSGDGQGEKEHYSQEVKHQIAIWSKGSNKAELFPETSLAAVRPDDSTFVLAQRPFDLQYARPPEEDYKAWKSALPMDYRSSFTSSCIQAGETQSDTTLSSPQRLHATFLGEPMDLRNRKWVAMLHLLLVGMTQ